MTQLIGDAMDEPQIRKRGEFFAAPSKAKAIMQGFTRVAMEKHAEKSKHLVSPENRVRVRHGQAWISPGLPEARSGGLRTHSAIQEVSFEDILNHNLTLIDRLSDELAESFARQMAEMVYSLVKEVCDGTGNVVAATPELPLHEHIYQALEKIEYTAGKNGEVQKPAFHIHPSNLDRFRAAANATTPELEARFAALDAQKQAQALAKESERRAKFLNYGGVE